MKEENKDSGKSDKLTEAQPAELQQADAQSEAKQTSERIEFKKRTGGVSVLPKPDKQKNEA